MVEFIQLKISNFYLRQEDVARDANTQQNLRICVPRDSFKTAHKFSD